MRTVRSQAAVISVLPSGANCTETIQPPWSSITLSAFPLLRFQMRVVKSALPEASFLPSGEKASERAGPTWPLSVWSRSPFAASHSVTFPS
jgi:hypothetical protein